MNEQLDTERLTQKQCAAELGVTARTLRDWQELSKCTGIDGGLGPFPRNRDGTYHLRGMLCWWLLYRGRHST